MAEDDDFDWGKPIYTINEQYDMSVCVSAML